MGSLGDHALIDQIVVIGDTADRVAHLEAFKFGQKTHMPQIHAENRHFRAMHQFGCAQNRAVAAKHDHDFGVVVHALGWRAESGRLQLAHGLADHRAALPQPTMRHHHSIASCHTMLSIRSIPVRYPFDIRLPPISAHSVTLCTILIVCSNRQVLSRHRASGPTAAGLECHTAEDHVCETLGGFCGTLP